MQKKKENTRALILKQREYPVKKANEIIQRAKFDLSLQESKLLSYIISKVRPDDTDLTEYTFSVKEYCQVIGIDYKNGNNYIKIKESLKNLRDKSFWMMDENGVESTVGWLEKAKIYKGSGKIAVRLDPDLQKYLLGMINNYTQYSLLFTIPMKSNYSLRLYELLRSYAFTKSHTFDLEDLKDLLHANTYDHFKDFRVKVIEIAIKEINLYTDLDVSWEPIYKGKKVTQVKFNMIQRDMIATIEAEYRARDQIEGQISIFDYDYYN